MPVKIIKYRSSKDEFILKKMIDDKLKQKRQAKVYLNNPYFVLK